MNIAYIITGLACGGAEAQLATICDYLKDEHNVQVFSIANNNEILDRFSGVKVSFYNVKNIFHIYKLYSELKKFNPDIIHSHMIHSNIISPPIAKFLGKPCFVTSHNTVEGSKFRLNVLKLIYNIFKPNVSHVSKRSLTDYIDKGVCTRGEIYINPIDLLKFRKGSLTLNEPAKWINIASLTDQKRHDRMIRVFEEHLLKYPDDTLDIYGNGPNFTACQKLVSKLNLDDRIKLRGVSRDVSLPLASSDYFLMSSDWEGLPVSIIEALASCVPVVSTNCGDIDLVVNDGVNGAVCDIDNDSLLNAMNRIRELRGEEYSKLAQNAETSVEYYSVESISEKLVCWYKRSLT
ncbi:glycosyltransferase [Vibrio alginolyticus]|uniref:glycosyltransferase n=1 Tax=Vibrio chagasii TaxID=170679 RepID=UPI001EFD9F4A|nr:glycosyltransferase [Vibrio chagasii]MCG9606868.1 glycosyltransferase [Vibrio chagasii]MDE9382883.1 glycosyltransferase [Vibrio alginolyticus]